MNRVELEAAVEAAKARMNAAMVDPEIPQVSRRNDIVVVFAGTDLPSHDVLQVLADNVNMCLDWAGTIGVSGAMQGLALNMFMVGFECGRRSA